MNRFLAGITAGLLVVFAAARHAQTHPCLAANQVGYVDAGGDLLLIIETEVVE